jgi:hypothetical protein
MVKTIIRAAAALAVLAGLGLAADFWEKKKYTEWDEDDVRKMLTDSPWAKKNIIELQVSGPGMMPGGGGRGGRGGRGGGGMGSGTMDASVGSSIPGGDAGGGGMRGMGEGAMSAPPRPTATLTVRWHSALPVKEAIVVSQLGKEAETSEKAQAYLKQQSSHYVLCLSGFPGGRMGMMGQPPGQMPGQDPEAKQPPMPNPKEREAKLREMFMAAGKLHAKKREAVAPEDVQVRMTPGGMDVYFVFSKANPLTVEDEHVDFELKTQIVNLKTRFNLKKMVFNGNLEL